MLRLRIIFHAGLLPPVVLLLRGRPGDLALMLPLGILHVLALRFAARGLAAAHDDAVVGTLQTAGFLHTLLGLGAAILVAGIPPSDGVVVATSSLIAPLGTAIVPHVLGVWLGHAIALRHARIDASPEEIRKRIMESGEAASRFLEEAQTHARRLSQSMETAANLCAESATRVKSALAELSETARRSKESARGFEDAIRDVSTATDHLVTIHRQLVDLLNSALLRKSA